MICFGLIGNPVSHSKSPQLYASFFEEFPDLDLNYKLFELKEISELVSLLNEVPELRGFNVTIPFKRAVIPFLNVVSEEVEQLQSCNTVKVVRDGNHLSLQGYNTDIEGFNATLEKLEVRAKDYPKALVLGNGGSSQSVQYALKLKGIGATVVSRNEQNGKLTYNDLTAEMIKAHRLIINTTPLGMWPLIEEAPLLPYTYINQSHTCIDLVYNPEITLFMKRSQAQGARVENGTFMLKKQAEKSWEIFSKELKKEKNEKS